MKDEKPKDKDEHKPKDKPRPKDIPDPRPQDGDDGGSGGVPEDPGKKPPPGNP
jgi:hypothetical protein